jgi:hypothetical protein
MKFSDKMKNDLGTETTKIKFDNEELEIEYVGNF